jgi:hypothetical protein
MLIPFFSLQVTQDKLLSFPNLIEEALCRQILWFLEPICVLPIALILMISLYLSVPQLIQL